MNKREGIAMEFMEFFVIVIFAVIALLVTMHFIRKNDQQSKPPSPKADYSHLYGNAPPPAAPAAERIPKQVQQVPPPQSAAAVPSRPVTPPVPKKPFSPIPLLLIAGVVFLFLGGVIFLTGTWDMLPDMVRALALLSASAVAFGINVLAERVLKLPKTGLAFYILGCIFLPLALGGIGAFSLLGEWFSFSGDGRCLLAALMAACVSATCFLGQSNYKSAVLAGFGLTGLGGAWMLLCLFLVDISERKLDLPIVPVLSVFTVLLVGFAAGMTFLAERYLRKHTAGTTPLSEAWVPYLFIQNAVWLLMMLTVTNDEPIVGGIGALVIALLFLNERFIYRSLHTGVFGYAGGLMIALYAVCDPDVFSFSPWYEFFIFVTAGTVFLLLTTAAVPKLRTETRSTMGIAGMILSIIAVPTAVISMLLDIEHTGCWLMFLFVPLIFAAVQFAFSPKNPLAKDTPHFALFAVLLYPISMILTTDAASSPLRLLLIFTALLLLVQSFLTRRLWTLALSICTCLAIVLSGLPHAEIWITCLCAAALLSGMIYAHMVRRPVLERCCGLAGIPFLLTSCCAAAMLFLEMVYAWILTLALLALIYLAQSTFLRHHLPTPFIRSFCLNLSVFLGIFVLVDVCAEFVGIGWLVLFALTLAVLTAGNLRRNMNIPALPMMIYLFAALREIVVVLERIPSLSEGWVLGLQTACFVLMLLLFAGMGRLLLPQGFYRSEGKVLQVDWGLLAAALPIFSVASTIDWYPSILCCLLLSVYSLFYIGRVKTRYIPSLLASAFGCLTIFFHNVNDPFGILEIWHNADFKAPQILLYLLPMHLFIASMLAILPQKYRSSVHTMRFCMYCFTMLCILTASLSFNRAEDGIILAVFSLVILISSFFVKRLRWFTLGFSVLFLMTVKLTWEFWKSLHWGIYLFLAGALLIGIAFWYEYAVRRSDESAKPQNPEDPKNAEKEPEKPLEKIALFKEWRW